MASSSAQAHKRSHSLLLFQKLVSLRDSASPLTLILDSLEQSAKPLLREFIERAKVCMSVYPLPASSIPCPGLASCLSRSRPPAPEPFFCLMSTCSD